MMDMDSRLRVARGIDKTETQASIKVFDTLKDRGHPDAPPPTISDGWGGIDEAMIAVYGEVPRYKGVGRPPTKKQPQPGWQYVQTCSERSRTYGQAAQEWASDGYKAAGHLWRPGASNRAIGSKHSLCGAHSSEHEAVQWALGA